MKKILIVVLLLLTITGCTNNSYKEPIKIKYDEYIEKINNKETFALLMWQTGCTHCEVFEPKLNKVIEKYKIKMYSIDLSELDDTEYAKIKNKTFISGTPTTVYFKDGITQPLKLVGNKDEDDIIEFFKEYKIIK